MSVHLKVWSSSLGLAVHLAHSILSHVLLVIIHKPGKQVSTLRLMQSCGCPHLHTVLLHKTGKTCRHYTSPTFIILTLLYMYEQIKQLGSYYSQTNRLQFVQSSVSMIQSFVYQLWSFVGQLRSFVDQMRSFVDQMRSFVDQLRSFVDQLRSTLEEDNVLSVQNFPKLYKQVFLLLLY